MATAPLFLVRASWRSTRTATGQATGPVDVQSHVPPYSLEDVFWYSCSRTQKLVSLSSAEAEVYACSSGTSDGILLCRLVEWMTGFKCSVYLHCDSSAARGIIQRKGVGKVRHLSCRVLWLQSLVADGTIKLACVAGASNPADIGTKRLPSSRLRSLMSMLGMFDMTTGLVEGADDPGRIFSKKQNVHAILSVLSLLTLKGCAEDNDVSSSPTVGLLVFTLVLGFCFTIFWMMVNGLQQKPTTRERTRCRAQCQ